MGWTSSLKLKLRSFNHLCTKLDLTDLEKLELGNMVKMVLGEEEHVCLINVPNVINLGTIHCHTRA